MNLQDIENKLIDYLDDNLSPELRIEVEQELEKSEELRQNLEELKMVMGEVDNAEIFQPSEKLQINFDQFLEKEKNVLKEEDGKTIPLPSSKKSRNRLFLQIAVAAAILFVGVFLGKNLAGDDPVKPQDLVELRTEMLNLLQKENSTSGRIKAVNISYEIEKPDDEIVGALIQTMDTDPSTNVRLAAMDALFNFANEPKVRTALCETLSHQTNPMIQLTLIKMLVKLKETQAVKYFEEIVKKDETNQEVKDEAQMGIFKMM